MGLRGSWRDGRTGETWAMAAGITTSRSDLGFLAEEPGVSVTPALMKIETGRWTSMSRGCVCGENLARASGTLGCGNRRRNWGRGGRGTGWTLSKQFMDRSKSKRIKQARTVTRERKPDLVMPQGERRDPHVSHT